ncbi:MAG: hypothetical protein RRY35_08360 [Clostridiales bacterium]
MVFVPKITKKKEKAGYKTLYVSQRLIEQIEDIARTYNTSFNNVVVSMIEYSIAHQENDTHNK